MYFEAKVKYFSPIFTLFLVTTIYYIHTTNAIYGIGIPSTA